MDEIHSAGIALAGLLQEQFQSSEKFWLWLTYLGDPGTIFLIYFPLSYYLQHRLGVTVLWIALLSEWLNLVFKWLLFGERPFWWIHESGKYDGLNLTQFPSTCETGPGSPSGHCMITGAALWPVVMYFNSRLPKRTLQSLVPVLLYTLLIVGVAISRILILAHFPHQVLAGIITGVCLGHSLQRTVPGEDRGFQYFALVSLMLLLAALLLHFLMNVFGMDLSWSISLATKWCAKPEWIRLESRPFSSITRSAGNALGLGFALHCPLYRTLRMEPSGCRRKNVSLVLSFLFLSVLHNLPLHTSSHLLFYSLNFLRHILCPLAVMILAPYVVQCLTSDSACKRD
ncbi:hypothetical protein GDO86_014398 [Hymenochirus boettgeri]|uniref:Glucose-6-phosphatase n=1 Tax=Hymenochirus boettgeri TaxID=247094 RepID=A0A8T2JNZ9_9PIPI|nr:hypothetical protein GDO86_014398 [Hymenochirus boettgeri]KAG8446929.1 hypothetical protein GDO86_014398 [Hymenochirus boettgeri]